METQVVDQNVILAVFQALGLMLGAGAAFVGNFLFFRSIEDGKLSAKDVSLLETVGKMIWGGLLILVLATLILFLGDTEVYVASTVFWVQMSIIFVIFINALFFYYRLMPKLKTLAGSNLHNSESFKKLVPYLFACQGVSVSSWVWLVVLSVLIYLPFAYWIHVSIYLLTLILAVLVAFAFARNFFDN